MQTRDPRQSSLSARYSVATIFRWTGGRQRL